MNKVEILWDSKKRKTARDGNLRYVEFWSVDQVKNWVNNWKKAKLFSKGTLVVE